MPLSSCPWSWILISLARITWAVYPQEWVSLSSFSFFLKRGWELVFYMLFLHHWSIPCFPSRCPPRSNLFFFIFPFVKSLGMMRNQGIFLLANLYQASMMVLLIIRFMGGSRWMRWFVKWLKSGAFVFYQSKFGSCCDYKPLVEISSKLLCITSNYFVSIVCLLTWSRLRPLSCGLTNMIDFLLLMNEKMPHGMNGWLFR